MDSASPESKRLRVSVESTAEWQIHDILNNGQERYLEPLVFADHVAKLAHKVNWKELIGDTTTRDDPSLASEDSEEACAAAKKGKPGEDVGPWDSVAKRLHEALSEVNVLLDVVRIGRAGQYVQLQGVFEAERQEKDAELKAKQLGQPADQEFKKQALVSKRKALSGASSVLISLLDKISDSNGGDASLQDRYLHELKDMRQRWRLKKLGNLIIGDLGYQTNGVRYRPGATFEVKRKTTSELRLAPHSTLALTLPRQLRRPTQLHLYVQFDDPERPLRSGVPVAGAAETAGPSDEPWESQLRRAQATLINREIFQQLAREAVGLESKVAVVQSDWLAVSLGAGFLLKLRLVPDGEAGEEGRSPLLEANLRRLHTAALHDQLPLLAKSVSLPLHMGPRPGRRPNAGPKALPAEAKAAAAPALAQAPLLSRLLQMGEHWLLVRRTLTTLAQFKAQCQDPLLLWNWAESGPYFSVLRVQIATPSNDFLPKSLFFLELDSAGIRVVIGGGETIRLGKDLDSLTELLWVQGRAHQLSELCALLRSCEWRLLYSTSASVSPHGTLVPTLLAGNASGSVGVCVRLGAVGRVEVFVQSAAGLAASREGLVTGGDWALLRGAFRQLNYDRLQGANLVQKLDLLLASLNAVDKI